MSVGDQFKEVKDGGRNTLPPVSKGALSPGPNSYDGNTLSPDSKCALSLGLRATLARASLNAEPSLRQSLYLSRAFAQNPFHKEEKGTRPKDSEERKGTRPKNQKTKIGHARPMSLQLEQARPMSMQMVQARPMSRDRWGRFDSIVFIDYSVIWAPTPRSARPAPWPADLITSDVNSWGRRYCCISQGGAESRADAPLRCLR